jgi:murein DD-endopeptidase MepM/ murein hydrolase activator NlpD
MRFVVVIFLAIPLLACTPLQMATYRSSSDSATTLETARAPTNYDSLVLEWPTKNARLTRGFSPYRMNHYGIDLAKAKGEPIYAAHDGKVIYVGNKFRGFGKLVILEHPSGWGTLYAHNTQILVKEGQWIGIGKKIATMGRTGNARGVHLHFELRKNKKAVDPLLHLPKL